ncbi:MULTISPECIES: carboxylesterase family protein [unclassified Enterococcus]|uniref:carboxylesterase family protein n=1 Tax=unclassified Enterococcus TaxID=2608891 RepID=UPI001CE1C992|nr:MULTISPECIES: carboxylesterase family protein [unclassified Enterococcus]
MKKFRRTISWVGLLLAVITLGGCTQSAKTEKTNADKNEETSVVRETAFGKVKGYEEKEALVWLGVPYGGETAKEARWKAPTDPQPWEGERDATKAGSVALQTSADGIVGSEDGLNLDIYRPNNDKKDLPVLVYIHGGNNQTGTAEEISGVSFVTGHDAIVVSVNYRLGPLGFNPLPALKNGTKEENSGNYTLLDLSKSLDWVKQNIENFGGDQNNITVSGFSAGGRDVMAMLISPIFEGKFDKAISFSGGMTIADEKRSQEVYAQAIAPLVVEDGLKENETQAKDWLLSTDQEVKDYLYALDGDRLVGLMSNAGIRMSVFPHLFNDGYVLPKEGFDTENYHSVPLMMLTGEQEFSLFGRFDPYFSQYLEGGKIDADPEIANQYAFINNYGGQLYSLFNVQESAEKMNQHYQAAIYGMEIEFGADKAVVGEEMAKLGAFHGVFVPLLDTESKNYAGLVGAGYDSEGAKDLSKVFQNYLFEFIKNGDPNGSDLPKWEEWQAGSKDNLLFVNADKKQASAKMGHKTYDYEKVLEAIDQDTTVSENQKQELLNKVMNGRWFSKRLDEKYEQLSDFDKE